MNVASLDLCKELHTLSGWTATSSVLQYWVYQPPTSNKRRDKRDLWRLENIMRINEEYGVTAITDTDSFIPAYDAGFLLRKLPQASVVSLEDGNGDVNGYYADSYKLTDRKRVPKRFDADTPEDAAAKLAIKLFKQGILKREGTDD